MAHAASEWVSSSFLILWICSWHFWVSEVYAEVKDFILCPCQAARRGFFICGIFDNATLYFFTFLKCALYESITSRCFKKCVWISKLLFQRTLLCQSRGESDRVSTTWTWSWSWSRGRLWHWTEEDFKNQASWSWVSAVIICAPSNATWLGPGLGLSSGGLDFITSFYRLNTWNLAKVTVKRD